MNKILGLTGGIGMGKTTVARLLGKAGWPVVDSDDLARDVVRPDQPALEEIRRIFGDEFIQTDGRLDRAKMAEHVFRDSLARECLEGIIHPRVRESWQESIAGWRKARQGGVVVIPLLFEVGAESNFDAVLCVACTAETQMARLRERGWGDTQVRQRMEAQLGIETKMDRSDHVLWNEGEIEALEVQLRQLGLVD
ncbi:MAG: dephospho-CoA kinase [Verrucomicrobiales bacterium]|nr:dephospho-CoA kinase [Verrucomicrobiales bacterium]|tara:strand:+ start:23401 stop:23985 length:585 start_codon:yes stop_codon:yes gene_type:complete